MPTLPAALSKASLCTVNGIWQRHVPAVYAGTALTGRVAMGRWGTAGGYPVLYLGRPEDSVVVEAYRHLIDPVVDDEGRAPPIQPRALITCEVSVTRILDLRLAGNRKLAGLSMSQMQSETYDTAAYAACQNVSAVAHQLKYHGLVAPAATKLGEALTLFMDLLPASEQPVRISDKAWPVLPADPRNKVKGKGSRRR
jgi:RES domain